MADTTIGNWFDKVFFDAHGMPCAGGSLFFYQTGTDIPLGVTTAGGVLLGACVRLDDDGRPVDDFRFYADRKYRVVLKDSHGAVVKQFDDVCILPGEGGGMYNPMTAEGDIIVGGTDGEPSRLAKGEDGKVMTTYTDDGVLKVGWQTPDHLAKGTPEDTHPGDVYTKTHAVQPLVKSKLNATDGQGGVIGQTSISIDADGVPAGHVLTADGDDGCNWAPPTGGMTNPMTALGDLIVGGASGVAARLGVGTDGQVLTSLSGSVGWAAPVGFANPMDGYGQMITGGAGGAAMKFAQPADPLDVLGATNPGLGFGCVPIWQSAWAVLIKGLANLGFGFTKGDLLFGGDPLAAAGDLTGKTELRRLAIGADGYVLKSRSGVPTWEAESGGMANPMTAQYDLIVGGVGGAPSRLPSSFAMGDILCITSASGAIGWASPSIVIPVLADIGKVKIDSSDAVGFLEDKLGEGTGITITKVGGKLVLSATGGGGATETCQENYSLLNSTNFYDVSSKVNTLYASKVISNATATRTKLGFFHKSGTTGFVILGVYDNSGARIAATAKTSLTSATYEQMCWIDTQASFTLTAGEEYWFAVIFCEDNWQCNINAIGKVIPVAFDANIVGSRSVGAVNNMPSSLGTLTYETQVWYLSAR